RVGNGGAIVQRAGVGRKAGVSEAVAVGVSAGVAGIADAVVVGVGLVGVIHRGAVVSAVEHAVAVGVDQGEVGASGFVRRGAGMLKKCADDDTSAAGADRVFDAGHGAAKVAANVNRWRGDDCQELAGGA